MAVRRHDEQGQSGVLDRERAALTIGLLLIVSAVAFEAIAVATVLPVAVKDIGGLALYGWSFSAFLLTSLVSTIAAGQAADRRGPALPFAAGILVFGCGLIVAGSAPVMFVFIAGRALQGLGAGAISAMAYVSISRAYPDALRARMLALQSSAWILPALVGPAVAGLVAERSSWRLVFLGLLPLLLLAGALLLPVLRRMGVDATQEPGSARVFKALQLAVGAGLMLAGLSLQSPPFAIILVFGGLALAWPALRQLLPRGTLTAQPGLPAGLAVHGLLNFGYFTAEAFLPLALTVLQHRTAAEAGAVLTVAALGWTSGSWIQARLDARDAGRGRRGRVAGGFAFIVLGGSATAAAVLTAGALALLAWVGWAIAGLGMGLAYPTVLLIVFSRAPEGQSGSISGAIRTAESLSAAIGAGVGGALIALGNRIDWPAQAGIGATFALAFAGLLLGLATSSRLTAPPSLAGRRALA